MMMTKKWCLSYFRPGMSYNHPLFWDYFRLVATETVVNMLMNHGQQDKTMSYIPAQHAGY